MNASLRTSRRALRRRLAVAGVVASGALLLAACGDDSMPGMNHGSSSSAPAESGDSTGAGAFNDADVTFAQGMIPHHQQALEMSELADGRASDPEIKKLVQQIEDAQDPEIKTMQGWLKAWGKPESAGMDHGAGHGGGDMPGMMSDDDMKKLEAAKDTDFDREFARLMIEHHNGAIEMARTEQKDGRNAGAKKLATAVIKGQSAEVAQFNKILDRL
jgi:uncharacterized protein (DUF305 family)